MRSYNYKTLETEVVSQPFHDQRLANAINKETNPQVASLSLWKGKETWWHVDLAQLGNAARKLKIRLYTFENPHMCEANLLDEFQLGVFG